MNKVSQLPMNSYYVNKCNDQGNPHKLTQSSDQKKIVTCASSYSINNVQVYDIHIIYHYKHNHTK